MTVLLRFTLGARDIVRILKLGVTSFGGPIAHIGYFREEIVVRRRWLDDAAYTDLVALCQFLPGPASSQVGCSLGLLRAAYIGGMAVWIGFTLPSAILLTAFAYGASSLNGSIGTGVLHGLKMVAVAIVAQAVWGMARTLCPDRERASIAGMAALMILSSTSSVIQLDTIVMGGIAGLSIAQACLCSAAVMSPSPSMRYGMGQPRARSVSPPNSHDAGSGRTSLAAHSLIAVRVALLRWGYSMARNTSHSAARRAARSAKWRRLYWRRPQSELFFRVPAHGEAGLERDSSWCLFRQR